MGCGQSSPVIEISNSQSDKHVSSPPSTFQHEQPKEVYKPENQITHVGGQTPNGGNLAAGKSDGHIASGRVQNNNVGQQGEPTQTENIDGQNINSKSFTIKEVSVHNSEKGYIDLFPWKANVHSSDIFRRSVNSEIETYQNEHEFSDFDKSNFEESWKHAHPMTTMMTIGIKCAILSRMVIESKVGILKKVGDKEYFTDIFQDAKEIEKSLLDGGDNSPYEKEYLDLLSRFFKLYSELGGNMPFNIPVPSGDPNTANYPLPKSVDPSSIRVWITDWEEFDLEMNYDNEWNCPWGMPSESEPILEEVLTPELLYRPEPTDLEPFQHEIEGEAAWELMELDIVKNDTPTPSQEILIEKRSRRTDLEDPDRMKRRREKLAQYFINERAEGLPTYCDDYMRFSESLEEGWKRFLTLCDS